MSEPTPAQIEITLNGDPYRVEGDARLAMLLERLNMRSGRVAVEINNRAIPKATYPDVVLKAGDSVEVINFVGGG
ncbi:MAG: sulfur carrier protein ThiS [Candidatus Binataceae bacterium]